MKNRKWLTYTVGILLTLVVLAAVGGAGFRIGMMQNASFARPSFAHNFDGAPQAMQGNFHRTMMETQSTQGNSQDNGNPQPCREISMTMADLKPCRTIRNRDLITAAVTVVAACPSSPPSSG